jgi:EpsI family protein
MKPVHKQANARKIQLERMVPAAFGAWKVDPNVVQVAPSTDVQTSLNKLYDQIVSRTYVNNRGERIMLTIAYGGNQNDSLKAHRQEVCYSSQGFKISHLVQTTLEIGNSAIPVTRMLAVQGNRSEPVTYWFTMGDRVVLGRFERLMVQLKYGLSGEIPDGMLVRVSNLAAEPEVAYRAHLDFVHELIASMKKEDAGHLLGGLRS